MNMITILKSKIHRATVTEASLDYVGSISLDPALMEAAGILNNEKVLVADITNGNRLEVSDLTAVVEFAMTGDPTEDTYVLNGTGAFSSAEGKQYSAVFDEVTSDFECFFPTAGDMQVDSSDPVFTATVDFGDGTCDTLVTVTIGDMSMEIDLADWLEQAQ